MLKTPYIRDHYKFLDGQFCSAQIPMELSNYNLFRLKTRLIPTKMKIFPPGTDIEFIFNKEEEGLRKTVVFFSEGKEIFFSDDLRSKLQKEIDKITQSEDNNCLLFYHDIPITTDHGARIPASWLRDMMQFALTAVPEKYKAFVKDGNILADLSEEMEYKEVNADLNLAVLTRLTQMYSDGYLINAESLKDNWNLKLLRQNLYVPTWKDKRFAPNIVDFLIERMKGNRVIRVKLGRNNVDRHFIAKYIISAGKQFYFDQTFVVFETDNIDETMELVSGIELSTARADGKTIVMTSSRLSYIKIYQELLLTYFQTINCVTYISKENGIIINLSCIIPLNRNLEFYTEQIKIKSLRVLANFAIKYPDRDIHEMIEDESFIVKENLLD